MIPFMKGYTVFNADQIDGLPTATAPPRPRWSCPTQSAGSAPMRFAATGIDIRYGGNKTAAFTIWRFDRSRCRRRSRLPRYGELYATWPHETVHATRHRPG